ncbi:low molecular weight protein-tyrosine-phosphatase [Flexithrix dorotheae]|uniref:low molecular weight protein-tyrosine-phosphatase n=1 Tax=Flexithrix dorotheae TaxID=70993 RepID=UPI0004770F39|nr:low molecular weight protein-tyrosine-phosphatase [Flexithrix dorotheae]
MIKVLFVCLGNICRSPMAEGIFQHLVEENELQDQISCDSAGMISFHQGELPDKRMRNTASKNGITLTHRSRPFTGKDFQAFDYIIAMDKKNLKDIQILEEKGKGQKYKLMMMRDFDRNESGSDVEDPYYKSDVGFDNCYQVLMESNQNFLNYLVLEHGLTPKN